MYPTMAGTRIREIKPQAGPQETFLTSPADIAIYGGAAGGGKTWALLLDPLRHINNTGFGATIFRRTFPEISYQGGMWDESEKIYPHAGGSPTKGDLIWRWGPGARIEFAHLQYDDDLKKYLGAQICMIGFDQLETFTEKQFFYMVSRNRSMCGVRPYIRATCNPDPDSWLAQFIGWWIAEDGYADLSKAGALRWFVRANDVIVWADTREELKAEYPELDPLSVTFIPATVYDNKLLLAADPGYLAKLMALPYVERERLLGDAKRGGNWKIRPAAGKVFNRGWFKIVPNAPEGGVEGRGWDFAATLRSLKNKDPDYTASVKMRKVNKRYYVLDMTNDRFAAGEIYELVKTISQQDSRMAALVAALFLVRWEIEPGSAALRDSLNLQRELAGLNARGIPSTGDKLSRWKGIATEAEAGNVYLVEGPWNEAFLGQLHGQPDLPHDDVPDAASVIFEELKTAVEPEPPKPSNQSPLHTRGLF